MNTPTDPTTAGKTPTQETTACEVPLIEQLRSVPIECREIIEVGYCHHRNIPYGALCHRAATELAAKDAELTQWQKRCGDLYELAITLKRHAKEAQEMYGIHAEELIEDADNVLGAVNSCGKPVRDAAREGAK